MMSNGLDGTNLPLVVWSLSFEMVFSVLLTALFVAWIHRRSSWYALAFAAAAAAIGGFLPQAYFSHTLNASRLVAPGRGRCRAGRARPRGRARRGVPRMVGAAWPHWSR